MFFFLVFFIFGLFFYFKILLLLFGKAGFLEDMYSLGPLQLGRTFSLIAGTVLLKRSVTFRCWAKQEKGRDSCESIYFPHSNNKKLHVRRRGKKQHELKNSAHMTPWKVFFSCYTLEWTRIKSSCTITSKISHRAPERSKQWILYILTHNGNVHLTG